MIEIKSISPVITEVFIDGMKLEGVKSVNPVYTEGKLTSYVINVHPRKNNLSENKED